MNLQDPDDPSKPFNERARWNLHCAMYVMQQNRSSWDEQIGLAHMHIEQAYEILRRVERTNTQKAPDGPS